MLEAHPGVVEIPAADFLRDHRCWFAIRIENRSRLGPAKVLLRGPAWEKSLADGDGRSSGLVRVNVTRSSLVPGKGIRYSNMDRSPRPSRIISGSSSIIEITLDGSMGTGPPSITRSSLDEK